MNLLEIQNFLRAELETARPPVKTVILQALEDATNKQDAASVIWLLTKAQENSLTIGPDIQLLLLAINKPSPSTSPSLSHKKRASSPHNNPVPLSGGIALLPHVMDCKFTHVDGGESVRGYVNAVIDDLNGVAPLNNQLEQAKNKVSNKCLLLEAGKRPKKKELAALFTGGIETVFVRIIEGPTAGLYYSNKSQELCTNITSKVDLTVFDREFPVGGRRELTLQEQAKIERMTGCEVKADKKELTLLYAKLRALRNRIKYIQDAANVDLIQTIIKRYCDEGEAQYRPNDKPMKGGKEVPISGLTQSQRQKIVAFRKDLYERYRCALAENRDLVHLNFQDFVQGNNKSIAEKERKLQTAMIALIDPLRDAIAAANDTKLATYALDDLQQRALQYICLDKTIGLPEAYRKDNNFKKYGQDIVDELLVRLAFLNDEKPNHSLTHFHDVMVGFGNEKPGYLPEKTPDYTLQVVDSMAYLDSLESTPTRSTFYIKDTNELWQYDRLGNKKRLASDCLTVLQYFHGGDSFLTAPNASHISILAEYKNEFDDFLESSGGHALQGMALADLFVTPSAVVNNVQQNDFSIRNTTTKYQKLLATVEGVDAADAKPATSFYQRILAAVDGSAEAPLKDVMPVTSLGMCVYFTLQYGTPDKKRELFERLNLPAAVASFAIAPVNHVTNNVPITFFYDESFGILTSGFDVEALMTNINTWPEDKTSRVYEALNKLSSILVMLNDFTVKLQKGDFTKETMQDIARLKTMYHIVIKNFEDSGLARSVVKNIKDSMSPIWNTFVAAFPGAAKVDDFTLTEQESASNFLDRCVSKFFNAEVSTLITSHEELLRPTSSKKSEKPLVSLSHRYKEILTDRAVKMIDQLFATGDTLVPLKEKSLNNFIAASKRCGIWTEALQDYFVDAYLKKMTSATDVLIGNATDFVHHANVTQEIAFLTSYFSPTILALVSAVRPERFIAPYQKIINYYVQSIFNKKLSLDEYRRSLDLLKGCLEENPLVLQYCLKLEATHTMAYCLREIGLGDLKDERIGKVLNELNALPLSIYGPDPSREKTALGKEIAHGYSRLLKQRYDQLHDIDACFLIDKADGTYLLLDGFVDERIERCIAENLSDAEQLEHKKNNTIIAKKYLTYCFSSEENVVVDVPNLIKLNKMLYGTADCLTLFHDSILDLFQQYDQSFVELNEKFVKIVKWLEGYILSDEAILGKKRDAIVRGLGGLQYMGSQDTMVWLSQARTVMESDEMPAFFGADFVDKLTQTISCRKIVETKFSSVKQFIEAVDNNTPSVYLADIDLVKHIDDTEASILNAFEAMNLEGFNPNRAAASHFITQPAVTELLKLMEMRNNNFAVFVRGNKDTAGERDLIDIFYNEKVAAYIIKNGTPAQQTAYTAYCDAIAMQIVEKNFRVNEAKLVAFSPSVQGKEEPLGVVDRKFSGSSIASTASVSSSGTRTLSTRSLTNSPLRPEPNYLDGHEDSLLSMPEASPTIIHDEAALAAAAAVVLLEQREAAAALEALRHQRESTKETLIADIARFEQSLTAYKTTLSNDWWLFSTKKSIRTQSVDELLTKIHRVQASFKKPDFVDSFELLKDFFSHVETIRAGINSNSKSRLLKVLNESNCDLVLSAEQLDINAKAFNDALFSYHVVKSSEPTAAVSVFFVDRVAGTSTSVPLRPEAKLPSFIRDLSNSTHKKNLSLKELDKIKQRTGHVIPQSASRNFTKKSAAAWYQSEMSGPDIHTRVFDAETLHAKFGSGFVTADPLRIDPAPNTESQQALRASQSQLITTLSASKTALQNYLQKKGRSVTAERAAVVADLVEKIDAIVKQLQYPQEIDAFKALVTQLNALVTTVNTVKSNINNDLDKNYTLYRGKSDLLAALEHVSFASCQKHALEWTASRFKQADGLLSLNARCATREALEAELRGLVPTMTPEKVSDLWDQVEPLKTKVVQEALLANNFEWQASDANLPIEVRFKALRHAIFSLIPSGTAVPVTAETRIRANSEDLRGLIAKLNQADAAFNTIKQSPELLEQPLYAHLSEPQEAVAKSLHAVAMYFHCSDYLAEVLLEEQWQLPENAESLPADIKLAAVAKALPRQLDVIGTLMDQPDLIYTAWATATDLFEVSKDAGLADPMVNSVVTQLLVLKKHWLTSYLMAHDFAWPEENFEEVAEEDQLQSLRAAIEVQFVKMTAEVTAFDKLTLFKNAYEACAAELPGIAALKHEIATKGQAWFVDACCEHDFSEDVLDLVTDKALLLPWLDAAIEKKSAQLHDQDVGVTVMYNIINPLKEVLARENGSPENATVLARIQAKLDELGAQWITSYLAKDEELPVEIAVFSDKAYFQGIINASGKIPTLAADQDQDTIDFYNKRTKFLIASLAKRSGFQAIYADGYSSLNVEPLKDYLKCYLAASCDLLAKNKVFRVDVRMVELAFTLKHPFSIQQLLVLLTPGKLSVIEGELFEQCGKQLLTELLQQLSRETCSDQDFQDAMECLHGWLASKSEAGNESSAKMIDRQLRALDPQMQQNLHKMIDRQLGALNQNMQQGSFGFIRELIVTRGLGTEEHQKHPLFEKYATVEKDSVCMGILENAHKLHDHYEAIEEFNQHSLHERYTLEFSRRLDALKNRSDWEALKPAVRSLQTFFLAQAWSEVVKKLRDMGLNDSAGVPLRNALLPMAQLLSLLPPAVIVNKPLAERLSTGTFKSSTSGLTDSERNSSVFAFSQMGSQLTSLPSTLSMSGKESLDSEANTDRLSQPQRPPRLAPSLLASLPVMASNNSFDSNVTTDSGYSSGEVESPIANSSQSSGANAELYRDRKTFILALMQEAFNRESPVPQKKRLLMLKEALMILRGLSIDGAKESITEDADFQENLVTIFMEENPQRLSILNLELTLSEKIVAILNVFRSHEDTAAFAENLIEGQGEREANAKLNNHEKYGPFDIVIEQVLTEQYALAVPIKTKGAELQQFLSQAIDTATLLPITCVNKAVKYFNLAEEFKLLRAEQKLKKQPLSLPHCFVTTFGLAYVTKDNVDTIANYKLPAAGDKFTALIRRREAITNNTSLTFEQQAREKDYVLREAVGKPRPFLTPLALTAGDLATFTEEQKHELITSIDEVQQQTVVNDSNKVFALLRIAINDPTQINALDAAIGKYNLLLLAEMCERSFAPLIAYFAAEEKRFSLLDHMKRLPPVSVGESLTAGLSDTQTTCIATLMQENQADQLKPKAKDRSIHDKRNVDKLPCVYQLRCFIDNLKAGVLEPTALPALVQDLVKSLVVKSTDFRGRLTQVAAEISTSCAKHAANLEVVSQTQEQRHGRESMYVRSSIAPVGCLGLPYHTHGMGYASSEHGSVASFNSDQSKLGKKNQV